MANITQPWLEDLSEEWIPQDTPGTIARPASSAADAPSSQSVAPKQRSRLPRMRQSSTSFSEIQVRSVANQLRPPKQRSALAERSLSENNIPPNSSPEPSNLDLSRSASHALSASQSSDQYNGTVAHHTVAKSPAKEKKTNDTPEWKRRLVKGELGYGDQTDLFGNTGLQNIFQKPNETSPEDTPAPNRKLGLLKGLTALPSSPPPWPPIAKAVLEVDHTEEYGKEQPSEIEQQNSSHFQPSMTTDVTSSVIRGPSASTQTAPRTVSGQIEFENESFSPVYLTTNLKVGNTPKPTPNFRGSELANRLRQIGSPPPSQYQSIREETFLTHSQGDSSLARLQDESLPEGLPAGTPDIADVGRFVELRRGGYSRDGSFRRRPLSPSPQRAASSNRDNASVTANEGTGQRQDIQTSCDKEISDPKTPSRRAHQHLSPERAKTSGSPLKLFDAHDTFTSNRLQRRLSQLENRSDKDMTSSAESTKKSSSNTVQAGAALSFVEEASIQQPVENEQLRQGKPSIRVESFGQGQLNQYQFSEDFTFSSFDAGAEEDSAPDGSPSLDIAPPGSRQPFKFHVEESPVRGDSSQTKRRVASHNSSILRSVSRPKFYRHVSRTSTQADDHSQPEQEYTEGKRGPTSPFKDPTPKRRRTIHLQEDEELQFTENDVLSELTTRTTHQSHVAMQSVIGKKRKDARHESNSNIADAETLARRHILRPRNPTPSQRRRDELEAEILEATEAFMLSSPKLNAIHEQLESSLISDTEDEAVQAAAIASKVAAFSMNRQKPVKDDSRKRSVTTQDFLDEAVKIMHFIRTKGRPSSGLGSLEETEAESKLDQIEETHPSSSLTFDRPPSREGRHSGWKEPNKPSLDPDVMNHLRKFQEKDNDTFLNSSVNSIRLAKMKGQDEFQEDSVVVEQDDIRITDDRSRHRRADENRQSERFSSQPQTNDTQTSTRSSLAQTVATSASRRSDHVATLAPEAVAHLIPEEVAGMTFDKEKNIWVRQRSPMKQHQSLAEDHSALNESEEDPFGNIPDLTVDEIIELEAVRDSPTRPMPTAETILEDTEKDESVEDERPVTREGKGIPPTDTSSVPSKVSNFAWSYPKTETRATSWSTQAPRNWSTQKAQHPQTTYAIPESEEDDIEHEIKYFEGRGHAQNSVQRHRVRDITVSFAERTALDEHPTSGSSTETVQHRQIHVDCDHNMKAQLQGRPQIRGAKTIPLAAQHRAPLFTGDGDLSLLDELPSKNYRMQLSMNIAAPVLAQRDNDALLAPSSPVKGDVTFMLSDLPEFTLNQVDECELPDRVVIKHDGTQFSKALEDRYAQGTADLVRALQDVEPDEPYWEDLRQVDLHEKGLSTLHRLDELCYQLEELDVSGNAIGQVKGIPYSMRRLHAKNNSLTGLTSWTMLGNLQYLDISGNDIDSLDGLAGLIHLRVLRVNNNKISSLEGIIHLDGLMEVNAGDNLIEFLDFSKSNMKSLTDLDLRGNRLLEVRNLHSLPRLEHLNLNDNEINEFPLHDGSRGRCQSLRSLKLCRNGMQMLDVNTYFPKIETLHVDGNCLIEIPGLDRLRHLRTLSAREQVLSSESDDELCVGNLFRNSDVRNLYVSLNQVPTLDFSQHLLNLQRLELASMGLKQLPDDFGQLTPNIRSVNLNFNSIKDLRPLLNIKRLNELLLVGNKLERLRANAMVLGKLTTLSKLDWRDNPLTLRFYPSAPESRIMSLRQKPSEEQLLEQFVLPAGDIETDTQHLTRLDFETRIRRRVTEMMLANLCRNLRELDGLPFDKARVLIKDDIWDRMLLLGVIQRKQADNSEDEIR